MDIKEFSAKLAEATKELSSEAVSYTHLTLPTT